MTGSASTQSALLSAIKRVSSQPAFLAAFVVLFVAALSLNAATQFMRLYFKKEPVPLVKPLDVIPPRLGPWVQVSADTSQDPEMLDVLGTRQYIFRDFVDSRLVSAEQLAEFKKLTEKEKAGVLSRVQAEHPEAVLRAAVTYYTGMVDTVAHIPDRCYVADGYEVDSYTTLTWAVQNREHQPIDVQVHYINFEDTGKNRGTSVTRNVAYFFQCNGDYVCDPVMGVRVRLQNLSEKHGYYAKIELMNEMKNRDQAQQVMRDFLTNALPEIEQCLPDWNKVKASEK